MQVILPIHRTRYLCQKVRCTLYQTCSATQDCDLLFHAVQAIEFVQMQRDDELWELLISLSLESPALTGHSSPSLTCKVAARTAQGLS